MSPGIQRFCAWCGPAFVAVFFVGMILAGFLPPPSPSQSAAQVAHFWSTGIEIKRSGLVLMMASTVLLIPFSALIAVHIKGIEGKFSPLTYVMLIASGVMPFAILLPVFIWAAASFRPGRSAEVTQALNDFGWLPFIMNWPPPVAQALAIGVAVFADKRSKPLWPRWAGYYNVWTAVLFLAGGFAVFFKTGLLAWNGILAFWMAATVFGAWFLVMCYLMLSVIPARPGDSVPDREPVRVESSR